MAKNKEFYKLPADLDVIVTGVNPFSYFFNLRALLAEAAKKRLNKSVFNWGNFPGAEVWLSPALSLVLFQCYSSGPGGWAAAVPEKLTSVFIITAQGRSSKKEAG